MEFVDGSPIAPVDSARKLLDLAVQIADGLSAAHASGIVHRDLKPDNILVSRDGRVKILDFGLAKAAAASAGAADNTATMGITDAGTTVGTVNYMSPEQARGMDLTPQSDQFSFGLVLYELAAGNQPFRRGSAPETMAAIIREEAAPLPAQAPAPLRWIIERLLAKESSERYDSTRDLYRELKQVRDRLSESASAAHVVAPASARVLHSSRLPWTIVACVLAVVLGVALWAPWRVEKPVELPLKRLDVDLGEDVSLPDPGPSGSQVAISPDGTRLVYVSGTLPATSLFIRRLDQARPSELPGTYGADYPFFSPDGQWVGFLVRDTLKKVSVEGGAVITLGDMNSFGNASWGENGNIIVGEVFGKGLVRYAVAGGPPQALAGLGSRDAAFAPQILPGGKAILFTAAQADADVDGYTIEVLTLADGHRKLVARGGASGRYVAARGRAGHLIYVNKTTLFAVPFDLDRLETRGTPAPVLDDIAINRVTGAGQFDWSRGADGHGVLVYRKAGAGAAGMFTLQWFDPTGKREPLAIKAGDMGEPRLSPDGERVALRATEGGHTDIWVYDPHRDAMTRLTFGGGYYQSPVWSPDGRYIVYESMRKGGAPGIMQVRADGASQPQALIESNVEKTPCSFAPDGKRLAFEDYSEGRSQIWTVPLEEQGGQLKAGKPEQFFKSNFNDRRPAFSPEGRWLAYVSNESGKYEVYVRAFPPSQGSGGKWQISTSGGGSARWSQNGHDLLYPTAPQIMAVGYTAKGETFVAEKPRVWIAKTAMPINAWDLAPDGKRALVLSQDESAAGLKREHEVVFLENFFDYLRQRAPIGK
jgi:serine/threonine-protein kinase